MIWLARLVFVVVLLVAWQLASGNLFPAFFLSKPTEIGAAFLNWVRSGELFYHAGFTMLEAVAGFVLGSFIGMGIGIWLGRSEAVAEIFDPFITMFYSLPKVALAPLFILWFGIGLSMKIYLTATIVFFLVFLSTYTGVRTVSREQIAILKLMGARERHIMTKVVIPSAITWVFTGLRLSVPYALIGAIVGELIASNRGLGYLLADSAGQFSTSAVFAALLAIVLLALLLNTTVKIIEKIAVPWKGEEERREMSI